MSEKVVAVRETAAVHVLLVDDEPTTNLQYPTSKRVPEKDELLPMEQLERRDPADVASDERRQAARMLGIGKTTLYHRRKQCHRETAVS